MVIGSGDDLPGGRDDLLAIGVAADVRVEHVDTTVAGFAYAARVAICVAIICCSRILSLSDSANDNCRSSIRFVKSAIDVELLSCSRVGSVSSSRATGGGDDISITLCLIAWLLVAGRFICER